MQTSPHEQQPNSANVTDSSRNQSVSEHQGTSAASYSCEHMDTGNHSVENGDQSIETGAHCQLPDSDPIDIAVVNRCLQEPVLCRDASETSIPSLLREVHEEASPQYSGEALSVLLHVLMLETGYVTYSQVFWVYGYSFRGSNTIVLILPPSSVGVNSIRKEIALTEGNSFL